MIFQRRRYAPSTFPFKVLSMFGLQSWLNDQLAAVSQGIPYDSLIDIRDLVDKPLGAGGDDGAILTKGVAKAPDSSTIFVPGYELVFETPFIISQQAGKIVTSLRDPRPLGNRGAPRIRWNGAAGERVCILDRAPHCGMEGFCIEPDGLGSTAYVAIDIDGHGSGPGEYGMGTHSPLRNILIRVNQSNPNYELIRFSETARGNQEFHFAEHVDVHGGQGATQINGITVTAGDPVIRSDGGFQSFLSPNPQAIRIPSAGGAGTVHECTVQFLDAGRGMLSIPPVSSVQNARALIGRSVGVGFKNGGAADAKGQSLKDCTITNLGIGVHQVNGSMDLELKATNNEIDVQRDNATGGMRLLLRTENSRQALVDRSGMPCAILAGSFFGAEQAKPNGAYIDAGWSLMLEGPSFGQQPSDARILDLSGVTGRFTSIGTSYPPGSTMDRVGYTTMPLNRPLVSINDDNIVDLPATLYVRGGKIRAELGWYGDDTLRIIEAVGHALSGNPTIAAFSASLDAKGNTSGRPTLTDYETQP